MPNLEITDLPEYILTERFELRREGEDRLWINDQTGLIGRYNRRTGLDIHTNSTCDDCRMGEQDFSIFVSGMLEKHSIDLNVIKNIKEINAEK